MKHCRFDPITRTCIDCGWKFPHDHLPLPEVCECPHISRRPTPIATTAQPQPLAPPNPPAPLDDDARLRIIEGMRAGIDAMVEAGVEQQPDYATVEHNLSVCLVCDRLEWYGCNIPCGCHDRWKKWRRRIIEGKCERLDSAGRSNAATSDRRN